MLIHRKKAFENKSLTTGFGVAAVVLELKHVIRKSANKINEIQDENIN